MRREFLVLGSGDSRIALKPENLVMINVYIDDYPVVTVKVPNGFDKAGNAVFSTRCFSVNCSFEHVLEQYEKLVKGEK